MTNLKLDVSGQLVLVLLASLLVSSCSNDDPTVDLQQYIEETQARQRPHIEPLPEIKPYKTFLYGALIDEYRNPFSPADERGPDRGLGEEIPAFAGGPHPDPNRRKEALEQFPLDSLRMQGTLVQGGQSWGIVKAPDGSVYRVKVDNYVGQHDGRIRSISEESIDVTELVPNGANGWQERAASMALNQ